MDFCGRQITLKKSIRHGFGRHGLRTAGCSAQVEEDPEEELVTQARETRRTPVEGIRS